VVPELRRHCQSFIVTIPEAVKTGNYPYPLEARIDWTDGGPPGSSVRVLSKSHIREAEKVRLYAR
jgi:hypothetical protein